MKGWHWLSPLAYPLPLRIPGLIAKCRPRATVIIDSAKGTRQMMEIRQGTDIGSVDAVSLSVDIDTITDIARRIGDLSVSIAAVSGDVQDVSDLSMRKRDGFLTIKDRMAQMATHGSQVIDTASEALTFSRGAEGKITATSASLAQMVALVSDLTDGVAEINSQLNRVSQTLGQVAKVTDHVSGIARHTNLLSLNAAVEAARAGVHGRGFAVVAGEVKTLSNQASAATAEIGETIGTLTQDLGRVMEQVATATVLADDIRALTGGVGGDVEALPQTLSSVCEAQARIVTAARAIETAITDTQADVEVLTDTVEASTVSLANASQKLLLVTDSSEVITGMSARLGVATVDTPYIEIVQKMAAIISAAFTEAVDNRRIPLTDFFDETYAPIPGTSPQQFKTRFADLTDAILPPFQETMLQLGENVIFCAATDRNGYIPTHNLKFSQPQRPNDPEWNAKHARNRRIFNDRVGLEAGRSKRPFLLQSYRRDMGNGEFRMMKDVSAPIVIQGKHWGGLRLAYLID